ncbi:hypothetical protein GQ600_5202 [Phytophthora cactorum]|nr:hypothetical protein GQ600_5202 [Phytophthora cactorum]
MPTNSSIKTCSRKLPSTST